MLRLLPRFVRTCAMIVFKPNIEHFLCLVLFSLISLLGIVLWTYEDDLHLKTGVRFKREDYQQLLDSVVREQQRFMEQRAAEFPEFPAEEEEIPDVLQRHRDHVTEASIAKADAVLKKINKSFRKPRKKKGNRREKAKDSHNHAGDSQLLMGGEAVCSVYDTKPDISDDFECITLILKPLVDVCLFPNMMDIHVSYHLRVSGIWEPHILRHFQNLLYQDPELGVYDIGAHIGQYSLLAAAMGRQVVAVEPHQPSQRRIHKAIKLGKLEDKIILVTNAVSDRRDTLELSIPGDNQGGVRLTDQDADRFCTDADCPPHATTIVMDDLLEVTNFEKAIMKIDIEGHEHRAFVRSKRLFETVDVQFIIMEWIKLREYYDNEAHDSPDKRLVFDLLDYLVEMGYTPMGSLLLNRLDPKFWYGWPDDVYWEASADRRRPAKRVVGKSSISYISQDGDDVLRTSKPAQRRHNITGVH